MTDFDLRLGDCLEVLRTLPDNSIDAVVTDPPYGLSFMGKKWDYDVPAVEVWAECLRVLKPGGHLLAFAGTRTQHRMAVRIEDAGFEIRDLIAWVYGSGFPKSHDVSKGIDKAKIEDDAARAWQGWGTALKPALEPITVARKPLAGTVAQNVLTHGTGAINVDGCRVGMGDDRSGGGATGKRIDAAGGYSGGWGFAQDGVDRPTGGRWPANLIHDGSDEVVGLFPDAAPASARMRGDRAGVNTPFGGGDSLRGVNDAGGSAARFFYCAKASKRDRDEGLEHLEERRKAGAEFRPNHAAKADAGETGNPYGSWNKIRNIHPTVKPTDLMRYLCRLVTPPGGTVLDPFTGSGSTGKAAIREGFRFVGIERESEYVEIARARIAAALGERDPDPIAETEPTRADLFAWGAVK